MAGTGRKTEARPLPTRRPLLYCSYCGARLAAPDVRYCGSCGGDLADLAELGAVWQRSEGPEAPRRSQRAHRSVRAVPAVAAADDWLVEPEQLPRPAHEPPMQGARRTAQNRRNVALILLAVFAIVVFAGGIALTGGRVAAPWSPKPTPRVFYVTLPPDWYLPDEPPAP